ncbi:MAG: class IV adenylate cyclase [Acidobacteriota bacterium]|nr:class IV adenylate cyclase [Acidobacteriota bacterium]MDW3229942.1 class IV adenylate cyclase [Acidobacteriota bacterium]MDY0232112.1 class IV adenylate cyclase [Candidatus Saccharicenans sp.]
MATNIEIKARARDFARQSRLAQEMSDTAPQILEQEDKFFEIKNGRLKLRIQGTEAGELIFYKRANVSGPRPCLYEVAMVDDPEALEKILTAALGVCGVIRKCRTVCRVGQTRIHLDQVEGLGDFIELEYGLRPDEDPGNGLEVVTRIMEKLEIRAEDLIDQAYVDMLKTAGACFK